MDCSKTFIQRAQLVYDIMTRYAEVGIITIPVMPPDADGNLESTRGKRPLRNEWQKSGLPTSATIDDSIMKGQELSQSGEYPCNVGILMGEPSKLICVDVDPRNGGLEWLTKNRHLVEKGIIELSGRGDGGLHSYFRYDPDTISIKKKTIAKGVDIIGTGAQVVAYPSFHAATMERYEFAEFGVDLASVDIPNIEDCPELLELIVDRVSVTKGSEIVVYSKDDISEADRVKLIRRLSLLNSDKGRHHQIGGWIHDAITCGMSTEEVYDLADGWLAQHGRGPDQPDEVANWIRDAKKKINGGGVRISPDLMTEILLDPSPNLGSKASVEPDSDGMSIAELSYSEVDNVLEHEANRNIRDVRPEGEAAIAIATSKEQQQYEGFIDHANERSMNKTSSTVTFVGDKAYMISNLPTTGVLFAPPQLVESWASCLSYQGAGKIDKSSALNVQLILRADANLQGLIVYDQFMQKYYITRQPPWPINTRIEGKKGLPLEDSHIIDLGMYISYACGVNFPMSTLQDAIDSLRTKNVRHPVKDYLSHVKWDGIPRVDRLCSDYLNCVDDSEDYLKMVSRVWLLSMVARIMIPGCKADYVPVLTSTRQGLGKSTAVAILGAPWTGELTGDISGKDALLNLSGKWVVEISEMDAFTRSEVTTTKAFISRTTDTFRPPYGRLSMDLPRSCIFVGTSNSAKPLVDMTGNRRFLTLTLRKMVNRDALIRDRDQIFAEAYYRFQQGESWMMTHDEEQYSFDAQAKRVVVDHLATSTLEIVEKLIEANPNKVASFDRLCCDVFRVSSVSAIKFGDANRVRRILESHGFLEMRGVIERGESDENMRAMTAIHRASLRRLEGTPTRPDLTSDLVDEAIEDHKDDSKDFY